MGEITFGMIKPEGIKRDLTKKIEQKILNEGLVILNKKKMKLSGEHFNNLYGRMKYVIPEIFSKMEEYMTKNHVIVMKIIGQNAVNKLKEIRGASNSCDASKGTIRGDYASDQDYTKLRKEGKIALNVFHASDKEDVIKDIEMFFWEEDGK